MVHARGRSLIARHGASLVAWRLSALASRWHVASSVAHVVIVPLILTLTLVWLPTLLLSLIVVVLG